MLNPWALQTRAGKKRRRPPSPLKDETSHRLILHALLRSRSGTTPDCGLKIPSDHSHGIDIPNSHEATGENQKAGLEESNLKKAGKYFSTSDASIPKKGGQLLKAWGANQKSGVDVCHCWLGQEGHQYELQQLVH